MEGQINILLVEDTETDAEIVKRALSKTMKSPFRIVRAETMAQAEASLRSISNVDLILLDLGLPDTKGGIDTFQRLENAKKYNIPTLILTSVHDRNLAMDIVGGGAEDYIRKSRLSREPESLCDAIEFALCRHKNVVGLKEKNEKALAEKDQIIHYMTGGYSVQPSNPTH